NAVPLPLCHPAAEHLAAGGFALGTNSRARSREQRWSEHEEEREAQRVSRRHRGAAGAEPERDGKEFVPPPLSVGDRPPGDAERNSQGEEGHRTHPDDPGPAQGGEATEEGEGTWLNRIKLPPNPHAAPAAR